MSGRATSATRQPPPAPPIKYLEAGSRLFNSAAERLSSSSSWPAKYLAGRRYAIVTSSNRTSRRRSTLT